MQRIRGGRNPAEVTFSVMEKNWYVLFTLVVKQEKFCETLQREGMDAFIPAMEYYRRDKKETAVKPMFPGYLFVRSGMDQEAFDRLLYGLEARMQGMVRQLKKEEGASALRAEEIDFFRHLLDENGLARMSHAYLKGGRAVVTDGPLAHFPERIVKTDRHNRLAWLDFEFMGRRIQAGLTVCQKGQPAAESQPTASGWPAAESQPTATGWPAAGNQPATGGRPAAESQPAAGNQPAAGGWPAAENQPAATGWPATGNQPAAGGWPATESQPAVNGQPVAKEQLTANGRAASGVYGLGQQAAPTGGYREERPISGDAGAGKSPAPEQPRRRAGNAVLVDGAQVDLEELKSRMMGL